MRGLKHTKIILNDIGTVASFTDAWIETFENAPELGKELSHLLQMRGLKLRNDEHKGRKASRIFYRCVD